MKCLIKATGWIGDALFTLSLPKKLFTELGYTHIDLITYRSQPILLLEQNPYITNVYLNNAPDESIYDKIFVMPVIEDKSVAPTIQFQKSCGLKNLSTRFNIKTVKEHDYLVSFMLDSIDKKKKIITYQGDWGYRRWKISEQESIDQKINTKGAIPGMRTNRPGNINYIIDKLKSLERYNFLFLEISPFFSTNTDPRGYCSDPIRYSIIASIIKRSERFLGAEGGLSNLAAGLGVKTIITTDHMEMMFGETGVMSQTKNIQLGPSKLFPGEGHIHLPPYLTDDEVYTDIYNIIC